MKGLLVVATVLALVLGIVWLQFYLNRFWARRRFIAAMKRPVIDCESATKIQAAFLEIMARGETPYLVVATQEAGVEVPEQCMEGPATTLDISFRAAKRLHWQRNVLVFRVSFNGIPEWVRVPAPAMAGLFSAETGRGVVLRESLVDCCGQLGA
ncbi:ClpXP protease specificity-enhancing factor SspB [Marinobacter xestospongiae]|uniref:ClpXP protease specificity-enhancing factor SspB n=1 Tax=Marinobacter xestospongiae TaxID=994319 RepID=UPI002004CD46|nr:ClpXP protease specificity-enhancing factor SspB [Marinobacter xestospongiae]MCK7567043.1 ClpXP protease specificity-enhancing factor SspB [Marinobacter xestospongiae]